MNERIKDIAVAAGAKLNEGFYGEICGILMSPAELEKFSESLIQECLLKINGAKIRNESYAELIERIKEDFGVE